ncbi:MAG: class I SAM-dependent methyltransferase [Candidatus Neomarinimicrobiota bacterium]
MKKLIKYFLNKTWYLKNLYNKIDQQGFFNAGHYYSPIPHREDIKQLKNKNDSPKPQLPDINLNREKQKKNLNDYIQFYKDLPFPENKKENFRYFYNNDYFGYSDAIFLFSFLLKNKPKKIIEIGSGFSSAVILDTIENFLPKRPDVIFIEPNPERLNNLIFEKDRNNFKLINKKLQETSIDIFSQLKTGDLLFIDSSHVIKYGSDLQTLFFNILPFLPEGVFVHFHDIFYPFEYPYEWLKKGIYWNEIYFLRAFLSYNYNWEIYFFNTYVSNEFEDIISKNMPQCLKNKGGSLYIQKKLGCNFSKMK